ncbi:MAG: flagellar brake protein [Lachnospiraceae bacterium]|nr:flagellar brake protein [Lachnospiraceae bacterium]
MLSKYVVVGNRVELQAVKRLNLNEERSLEERKVYTTKVYDIISDERIELLMPMEQTKLILLPVDGEYELCFYTDNGLYQCLAKVVDRYRDNNIYVLALDLTTNLRKYQRREFYRFSCALEMNSRELLKEEIDALNHSHNTLQPELPLKRSVIVDISGGGLRFVSNLEYEKGSMILCNYNLVVDGEQKHYSLVGKVLSVYELENRPGVYEHRVQYVNMDVDDREEIIKYIFNEERKSRHKEKGM